MFNRIETWELLKHALSHISYDDYSYARYDSVLNKAMDAGEAIYSGAYIMPSGRPSSANARKHRMHLKLIEQMLEDDLPGRLVEAVSMGKAFELLRAYPTIGDFLAYQFLTDLNYSTLLNFSEMDFVVPGPGARDGIRKCFSDFGGLNETDVIKLVAERQFSEFARLGLGAAVRRGQVETHEGVAGFQQSEEDGLVCLRAGMGLDVGEVAGKEFLCPLDGQRLGDIDEFAAAVVATAGVPFGIFVGQHRALCFEHRLGDDVLRSDQFDLVLLAMQLLAGCLEYLRVAFGKRHGEEPGHRAGSGTVHRLRSFLISGQDILATRCS